MSSSKFGLTGSEEAPVEMSLNSAFLLSRVEKGRLILRRTNTSEAHFHLLKVAAVSVNTRFKKLDFISPQCSQKLQTSYTRSPECVLYPISVKFQQCLIVFPSLQSDTLPYEER